MKLKTFAIGDTVFVRWQGDIEFKIVSACMDTDSPMRHWICKCFNGRKSEYWRVPHSHLSHNNISLAIKEHNRKQLNLV